jgi:hypothetical protein
MSQRRVGRFGGEEGESNSRGRRGGDEVRARGVE